MSHPAATVKLMGGPADGREVRVRIATGQDHPSIPAHYYALDKRGATHKYVARTTRADDGDIIKADHVGLP